MSFHLAELQGLMRDQALDRIALSTVAGVVLDNHPIAPEDRLRIYRNNTMLSLTDALAAAYPVVARLVGPGFFSRMAEDFSRRHPPRKAPLLMFGGEFPAFVADYAPAASLPYLSDVARLEAAWAFAYHAEEAEPIHPAALMEFPEDRLEDVLLRLHPSHRFVNSAYPIDAIWRINQPESESDEVVDLAQGGVNMLVCRPDVEVVLLSVGGGAFAFLMSLAARQPLGVAWTTAVSMEPEFQLLPELTRLLSSRVFVGAELA